MPKHWRGVKNTEKVRLEFTNLFKDCLTLIFEDIASIFVTPCILIFKLLKFVEDVLQFVNDFTVEIKGIGHVCSLSVFDFEHHDNSNYGSPFHTSKDQHSSQGKMEKSFISFKTNYPNWEPDVNAKQLMSQLSAFRLRNDENVLAIGQLLLAVQLSQSPNEFRSPGHSHFIHSINSTAHDRFGHNISIGRPLMNEASYQSPLAENSKQIYWLDKFYTASQLPQHLESGPVLDERHRDSGLIHPDGLSSRYGNIDERLSIRVDNLGRLNRVDMDLLASTQGIFGNQGIGQAAGERWWQRKHSGSTGAHGESSFEPPIFSRGHLVESHDDFYESEVDHERDCLSQRHSRVTFGSSQILEDENSQLEFPFGDVYQSPPGEPALNTFGGPVAPESSSD